MRENEYENVICNKAAILAQPQYIQLPNLRMPVHMMEIFKLLIYQ